MDGGDWTNVGVVATAAVTLVGSFFTRRTARDSNAVAGFEKLTDRLEKRIERLETAEERRARLAVEHRQWDVKVADRLRALGEAIETPPPLD